MPRRLRVPLELAILGLLLAAVGIVAALGVACSVVAHALGVALFRTVDEALPSSATTDLDAPPPSTRRALA